MPRFEDSKKRDRINTALSRLMEIGWISDFVIHDNLDTLRVEWTEKGKMRSKQVVEITTEFHGGADDLMALAVICQSNQP